MFEIVRKRALAFSAVCAALFALATPAFAQVTLPDTGVDAAAYVTAVIGAVGAVVVVVVGGYFAFMVVRRAMTWGKSATRG